MTGQLFPPKHLTKVARHHTNLKEAMREGWTTVAVDELKVWTTAEWCKENCQSRWTNNWTAFYFADKKEAALYILFN